eukprot:3774541-Prymnesium_polylepis.1
MPDASMWGAVKPHAGLGKDGKVAGAGGEKKALKAAKAVARVDNKKGREKGRALSDSDDSAGGRELSDKPGGEGVAAAGAGEGVWDRAVASVWALFGSGAD